MTPIQRIENFINGELQLIADELKEEIVDAQYEAMYDEYLEAMYLEAIMDQGADDCGGEWNWEHRML